MTRSEAEAWVTNGLMDWISDGEMRDQVARIRRGRILRQLVPQLPEDLRRVVQLRCIDRLSWDEVMRRLYVCHRTAQRQLIRAIDHMAGMMLARDAMGLT